MRAKLGIVSSFNVLCGNATYSQALLAGLPQDIERVQIPVPVELQRYGDLVRQAQVLKAVKSCDVVNIQMELGLYGPTPKLALDFLKRIIKHSKIVSLTMHRVEERPPNLIRSMYYALKQLNFRKFVRKPVEMHIFRVYQALIRYAHAHDATFIVHTHREARRIQSVVPKARVLVHPIVWPGVDDQAAMNHAVDLDTCFDDMRLPVIGLFGFVSEYKNFEQPIKFALKTQAYNVLLAGGTHPMSAEYGRRATPKSVFARISRVITEQNKGRFFIYTSPSDAMLMSLMRRVDIVVIPYQEVGQSGSGIASMAVQFSQRVIFSDTHCFRELFQFLNKRPEIFDIQSDMSFLYALKLAMDDVQHDIHFQNYNFDTNIKTYLQSVHLNKENIT